MAMERSQCRKGGSWLKIAYVKLVLVREMGQRIIPNTVRNFIFEIEWEPWLILAF